MTPQTISHIATRIGKSFATATPKNTAATFKKEFGIELQGAPMLIKATKNDRSMIFVISTRYEQHPKPMKVYAEYIPLCDTFEVPADMVAKIEERNDIPVW